MKKHFLLLTLILLTFKVGHAQTSVSGGIYTNTTWALAGSPYIVTDTIVVFPNVTLTIEPGVVVKFENDVRLEIRQAKLIAIGTISDSIIFTSNSSSPHPGIWRNIILNGDNATAKCSFCSFKYAEIGLHGFANYDDSTFINHSSFYQNIVGLKFEFAGIAKIESSIFNNNLGYGLYASKCVINSCTISNNQNGIFGHSNIITNTRVENSGNIGIEVAAGAIVGGIIDGCEIVNNKFGIASWGGELPRGRILNSRIDSNEVAGLMLWSYDLGDTVRNCQITNNGIGILDTICNACIGGPNIIFNNTIENNNLGIRVNTTQNKIYCNNICNNATYDFYFNLDFNNNIQIPSNYWCTSDSATIRSKIYDGYVNIDQGLVSYMPISKTPCDLTAGLQYADLDKYSFSIFPNPFSTVTTIQTNKAVNNGTIAIVNCYGQTIKEIKNISGQTVDFYRDDIPSGFYILRFTEENTTIANRKIVITD